MHDRYQIEEVECGTRFCQGCQTNRRNLYSPRHFSQEANQPALELDPKLDLAYLLQAHAYLAKGMRLSAVIALRINRFPPGSPASPIRLVYKNTKYLTRIESSLRRMAATGRLAAASGTAGADLRCMPALAEYQHKRSQHGHRKEPANHRRRGCFLWRERGRSWRRRHCWRRRH